MISKKKYILFFCMLILTVSSEEAFSQNTSISFPTGIYATHNDYVQHKLRPLDDYVRLIDTMGTYLIVFEKKGKNQISDCSKIWGFQYKYKLFRSDVRGRPPARVITAGKIVYYENGLAHLDMLKNESEEGHFTKGAYCYLSINLLSDLFPMQAKINNDFLKEMEKFKNNHKQYKKLFTCIESDYSVKKVLDCVKTFERER